MVKKGRKPRKRKARRSKKPKGVSKPVKKAIKKEIEAQLDENLEQKYVKGQELKYHGQSTNFDGSFWADNTGLIKTVDLKVALGLENNERIGT